MVDSLFYISFQPVLHNWCSKDRDTYYPVWVMVHVKDVVVAAGFPSPYLNSPLPYVHITVNKNVLSASLNKTFPSFRNLPQALKLTEMCETAGLLKLFLAVSRTRLPTTCLSCGTS